MTTKPRVLVVGGAGYIGSFTVAKLCREDRAQVTVLDDLSQGHRSAVHPSCTFVEGSIADRATLKELFSRQQFDAVIHFAALTSVGDSVKQPLGYFRANVAHTVNLLEVMVEHDVRAMVFSSTAATYGEPKGVLDEDHPQIPVNPYGQTKLTVERALAACAVSGQFSSVALRYFNACGAAADGSLGEDHSPETHLIPLAMQAALGRGNSLTVFGDDYETPDGTCVRDYVHVEDLAEAHVLALESMLAAPERRDFRAFNVGTGKGITVRQVIEGVNTVHGRQVPWVQGPRRAGDPPVLVAESSKIRKQLGWKPKYTELSEILKTVKNWMERYPEGY